MRRLVIVCLSLAAYAGGSHASLAAPAPSSGAAALDLSFEIASAVRDVKDRARAQESALQGYLDRGLLDDAERLAGGMEGWRRGVVRGKIAAARLRAGDVERAKKLLQEAETDAAETRDWGRQRIEAEIAEVRALLGENERAREIAGRLVENDPKTYEGRGTVIAAWAQATKGDLDGALETLATLDDAIDLYVTWWRTEGYLGLARRNGLEAARRATLLDKARASAEAIDGWKRAEVLMEIAEANETAGRRDVAVAALTDAEAMLTALPRTMSLKGPMLADLARAWDGLGQRERGVKLLSAAEAEVGSVSSLVERPAVLARVAVGYAALGRDADARRLLGEALDRAAKLQNPRPRALALSAICREVGRRGIALTDAECSRVDALLAGLRSRT